MSIVICENNRPLLASGTVSLLRKLNQPQTQPLAAHASPLSGDLLGVAESNNGDGLSEGGSLGGCHFLRICRFTRSICDISTKVSVILTVRLLHSLIAELDENRVGGSESFSSNLPHDLLAWHHAIFNVTRHDSHSRSHAFFLAFCHGPQRLQMFVSISFRHRPNPSRRFFVCGTLFCSVGKLRPFLVFQKLSSIFESIDQIERLEAEQKGCRQPL